MNPARAKLKLTTLDIRDVQVGSNTDVMITNKAAIIDCYRNMNMNMKQI